MLGDTVVEFNDINNLDQVRIALSEVAAEHPERVFGVWVEDLDDTHQAIQHGTCYNFIDHHDGSREARCLVGQVLDKFGLLGRLDISDIHDTVNEVKYVVGLTNEEVVNYLRSAQHEQDNDVSWGDSFLKAEKEYNK